MVSFNLRKIFHYSIFTFLVWSTLFYLPVPKEIPFAQAIYYGYQIQELLFRYGIIFIYGISLLLDPVRKSKAKYFGFFLIYELLSVLLNFDTMARRALLNIFVACVFYKTVIDHFDFSEFKTLSKYMFWLVVANVTLSCMQYFGCDPIYAAPAIMGKMDRMVGFMKIKADLGILASFLAPFCFALNPFLILFCLPLLFWGFSSSAIGGFLVSILLIIYFKFGRKTFLFLSLVLIALCVFYVMKFDMPTGQFGDRLPVWLATLSYCLKSNPYFGLGLGAFAKWEPMTNQVTQTTKLSWIWAHNEYLQLLFESGIAGLVIVIAYLRSIFKDFYKHHDDSKLQIIFGVVLVILVVSFFHFPFHLGRFSPLCVFALALFHARIEDFKNAND